MQTRQSVTLASASPDDYRPTVTITVIVRWLLLGVYLAMNNYRVEFTQTWAVLNLLAIALAMLNGYLTVLILKRRPMSWVHALAVSVADVAVITAALFLHLGFQNDFYAFYYPALLGFSLLFPGIRSFLLVGLVIGLYTLIAFTVDPTLNVAREQEKLLLVRVMTMVGMVAGGTLISAWERNRRLDAQERAREAERALIEERDSIYRQIHDGAAQSAYVVSLGLETSLRLVDRHGAQLRDRLNALHAVSVQLSWELRHLINVGSLFEGKGLREVLESHLNTFKTIASVPVVFSVAGNERQLPPVANQRLFSIAHNALTNVYKYAQASQINISLNYGDKVLALSIRDDGVGFDVGSLTSTSGNGIRNMRRVAAEMGGNLSIASALGQGTDVSVTVPL